MLIPTLLKKKDTIGLTCPAGYMAADKAQACIQQLQQWGYHVMVGKTLGSASTTYFSGTDEDRLDELQAMLDDTTIKAIIFGRGGYGVGRIIDKLNFTKFKKNPKWLIGFSDITLLHCHLHQKIGVVSLHAPMAAAFNSGPNMFTKALHKAISGKKNIYKTAPNILNKIGTVTAPIVGGNLSLIANAIGTPSGLKTTGTILFLEDIGEQLYSIDRMLHQLKRSGLLKNLAGLIFGGFTDTKDTERPFGKTVNELLAAIVAEYNYPVCFDFPISHNTENVAIKIGVTYNLAITKKHTTLKEL
jgi:muramoyltetrapeptide carboxypeptidase